MCDPEISRIIQSLPPNKVVYLREDEALALANEIKVKVLSISYKNGEPPPLAHGLCSSLLKPVVERYPRGSQKEDFLASMT